jgi:hypothetical protein
MVLEMLNLWFVVHLEEERERDHDLLNKRYAVRGMLGTNLDAALSDCNAVRAPRLDQFPSALQSRQRAIAPQALRQGEFRLRGSEAFRLMNAAGPPPRCTSPPAAVAGRTAI